MGGDMDGMGDLDNAPMPPMGSDDMGMNNDPMGGGDDMDMQEPPMGGEDQMQEPPMGGEDDELMSVVNNLSTEDKAAVLKYAKSMADDSEGGEQEPPMGDDGQMPMESRMSYRNLIDETINDVIDDYKGTERPNKKLPKEYRSMNNPFKSPY